MATASADAKGAAGRRPGATSDRLAALRKALASGPELGEFVSSDASLVRRPDYEPKKKGAGSEGGSEREDPPKPTWLRISTPTGEARANLDRLQKTVKDLNLATVCEEAQCPNIGECWGGKQGTATATIMIMGDTCTRGCTFCAVKTSNAPPPLDPKEPENVARAVAKWGLDYVVLTSVDRDDMADQGSNHFASTVEHLKRLKESLLVECLTPDFRGDAACITRVAQSGLDVYAHNVETVERLQRRVRDPRANFAQSLKVLTIAKQAQPTLVTKTSVMLGLGETDDDIRSTMRSIRDAGVDVITFGQYLRPSKRHHAVHEYVHPDKFAQWGEEAKALGFLYVASGPLVRSSYKAGEYFLENVLKERRAQRATAAAAAKSTSSP